MVEYHHLQVYDFQNVGFMEDEISNLPDSIIHHILSFLPSKDVVKTSILSKRWKNLWTCAPNIDFDDSLLYASEINGRYPLDATSFMTFVERVLLRRDTPTVRKFRLSCRVCFSASRICAWISYAITCKTQELDLCLFVEEPFKLPGCVFECKTLTVLKVEMNSVLELPACISFPCLKTLHLSLVTFPNDISTQKLLSSCPVLEDLVLSDCEWINVKCVTISSSTLKSLTFDDLPYFGSSEDPRGCEIKIHAENLTYLKYIGYLSNKIFLCNVSSLVEVCVHIGAPSEKRNEISYRAVELFKGMQNVNYLMISSRTIEMMDYRPLLHNLTNLDLTMKIEDQTVGPLMRLLHCTPNLQALSFTEGIDFWSRLDGNDSRMGAIPKCFLSSLKSVNLENFQYNESEMYFLEYVFKYALVLEKMNICCCRNSFEDPQRQREVENQIQMLARDSISYVVRFV